MTLRAGYYPALLAVLGMSLGLQAGCDSYAFLGAADNPTAVLPDGPFPNAGAEGTFTSNLIQARTFIDGTSVSTVTYGNGDLSRTPRPIDFNGDGKVDPVVGYGEAQAVMQILLSGGGPGEVSYTSLTLDSKRDMRYLADVAAGDIDGDGYLDLVGGAEGAVWYFHHPGDGDTLNLRGWGTQSTGALYERIDSSSEQITDQELEAIIFQALGPGVNLDDYVVKIEQRYLNVEIADFNLDGSNDIAASRSFRINLEPRPGTTVEPIEIVDGNVMVFLNPGHAVNGVGWTLLSAGVHEREARLDRDGASGLLAMDLDGDGDLDLLSSARLDNNAQVAWFENPGIASDPTLPWTQWRVGSVRDSWDIAAADLTGDGRIDVVASGGEQKQVMLFVQPPSGPKRTYDWDSYPIATFSAFDPRGMALLDIDSDGQLEIVCGATEGALRYFDVPASPTATWTARMVIDFDPPGDIGLLGYGDLDADGDIDLVCVVDTLDALDSRLVWVRNDLNP